MKKQLKKILFILLFIPIFINARVNYEDSVSYANNYIYGFEEYRDYIYLNENLPYSLEENGNKENTDFKSGGFLSRREYEISNKKGNTYLSNGLQYWTLTKSSYLKHYIIDYKLAEQFDQNLSGVRITEYVKPTTSVSGLGSYADPWTFKEMYSIHINSNLESTGKISESNCSNAKASIHLSLVEDETRPISICPAEGYRILHNSCDKYIIPINGSSTEHMVRGLDKDNIICKITFAYITKGITLKACSVMDANNVTHNCSPTKASPDEFYVNTNTGYFFKDEDAQYKFGDNEKITNLPSLTGYTFGGYKTSNGTIIIKSDGTLQNGKQVSSTTELTPVMTAKTFTITFDANGGTNLSKNSYQVTYNQKYSANDGLATVRKAGSKFLGWYTSTSGGTKINNGDLVKITKNTTLFARWETCPEGTKSDGVNCTNCAAGTYASAGSSRCTACPAGTYSGAKAGSCTACPAGQYNTGTGNTTCTKCVAGTYNTTAGSTSCTSCTAGTYNTTAGSTSCANCPAGQYNTGTGNTTCSKCGAGTYSKAGASSCTQCNAGYYSKEGASSCTACAAGTYNTTKGQSTCTSCPAGTYNDKQASTSCTNCAAGKYNTGTGNTSCSNCSAGKYNTGTGNTQCLNCTAGTYSAAGASSCPACPAGTYSGTGASSCTQCAAGKYNTGTGNTSCTNCPAGKYSTGKGNTSCATCAAGTYSGAGASSCTNCPTGYTSDPGSDSSSDCYIADSTPPTCTISINSSTSIKATYSDSGGSGIAYYGWNSSYSGTKSNSKTASAATHTFYVKDGAGNTGTCKITLAKGTTTYLCDGATLTSWHSGPSNGCNVYNGTYQCWWNGSSCSCNMAGFYTGTPYKYYCCSSYDNYETADWGNKVNGYPGCTHYFGSTGTSVSCSSGYSESNGWCYKR